MEWISVKDILPEINQKHICYFEDGEQQVGERKKKGIWIIGNRFHWDYKEQPTHWMPLPKPPKE